MVSNSYGKQFWAPGARVRVTGNSPWPERIGHVGIVVLPRGDGRYPQPAKDEALLLLDEDPLCQLPSWWSCVIGNETLEIE